MLRALALMFLGAIIGAVLMLLSIIVLASADPKPVRADCEVTQTEPVKITVRGFPDYAKWG